MAASSASRAGFRAVMRQPAVLLAEIAWRWSWGLAALAILAVSGRAFLQSVTVTNAEWVALNSRVPTLMADALARMLAGSGATLARIGVVVVPALAVSWIVAASLGRAATLKALFGRAEKGRLRAMLGLHFLRAAAALAAVICYVGASVIAGWIAAPGAEDTPQEAANNLALFLFLFLAMLLVIVLVWATVNWFLSLAPVFVARDARDTFGSLADAEGLFRRHKGEFTGVGFLIGLVKFFAIGVATVLSVAALFLIGHLPNALVIALLVIITVIYLAVADFLYLARLAAYIDILERERQPEASAQQSALSIQPVPAAPPPSEPPGATGVP